ncbi:chitinase 3-like [Zingiber officinale]|uniref:chitinase 3-like n=1 Tax=Zingiber officinale TaxID=94328 RepID=UPI001C4D140E|nr:chitinase 3-like [Zingiber officinale]
MSQHQPPQEVETNEKVPREIEQVQSLKVVQQPEIPSDESSSSSSTSSSTTSQEDRVASETIYTVSETSTSSSLPTVTSSTSGDTASSTPATMIVTRQRERATRNGHK